MPAGLDGDTARGGEHVTAVFHVDRALSRCLVLSVAEPYADKPKMQCQVRHLSVAVEPCVLRNPESFQIAKHMF
jgi:hypothetical protein